MACNNPLKAYGRLRDDDSGLYDLHFVNEFITSQIEYKGKIYHTQLELPCGQCMACRLKYSQEWAVRCMLESGLYKDNYFITLTYNDLYVPRSSYQRLDDYTGEVVTEESLSLRYSDVQLFLKRLRTNLHRKYGHQGVRFYGCCEYGSTTSRPHYHIIMFNCPLPDLEVVSSNFRGDCYYRSEFVEDCWSILDKESGIRVPLGFVTIGDVTYDSCAYTARYMTKKHKGLDKHYYSLRNIEPERSFMSLKPGIARTYFDENSEKIYKYDQIIITGADGIAKKVRPPRYYDNLYDIFSPEDMQRVKEVRIVSGRNSRRQIEERTSLSRNEYLEVCENKLLHNVKSLPRNL